RVSTEDQAERYSPAAQREQLRAYDRRKGYECVAEFFDDQSAKRGDGLTEAFDRRKGFQQLLTWLRRNRAEAELLEFVDWSRFSRDATAARVMIRRLERSGLECQAITQPIDWSIPEQRYMLALYLESPEVENA